VNPQNYKLALICVRMCKAFTYVKSTESSSVLLTLVKSVVLDLKVFYHIVESIFMTVLLFHIIDHYFMMMVTLFNV